MCKIYCAKLEFVKDERLTYILTTRVGVVHGSETSEQRVNRECVGSPVFMASLKVRKNLHRTPLGDTAKILIPLDLVNSENSVDCCPK